MNSESSWPRPSPRLQALRGLRTLQRADGSSWSAVLTPVLLDTAGVGPDTMVDLTRLDGLIAILLRDYAQHPLPITFIHLGPHELDRLDPLAFASFVVAHRAERLVQSVEVSAAALDRLEPGSLQLAASAARMLLELAFVTADVHAAILDAWYEAHGSSTAVLATASSDSPLWRSLWEVRLGTRIYTEPVEGVHWPVAINVKTRSTTSTRWTARAIASR